METVISKQGNSQLGRAVDKLVISNYLKLSSK